MSRLTEPVTVANPAWVADAVEPEKGYATDEEKMRLVIALSRENVLRQTGGPFGAAVFEIPTGRVVAVGVNSVVRLKNSALHAEMVALMAAQHRRDSFTLRAPAGPAHELVASCDPCAMCLAAVLWSGVRRVVSGATGDDARELDFDEGPVFTETYRYLEDRGIEIVRNLLGDEARAVLTLYRDRGGPIYNG